MNNFQKYRNMILHILLCMCTFGFCIGYENYDDGKRQDLYPFPGMGRGHWAWIEDKRQGLMPFPRVGRNSEEKRQGLIPFPRMGRSSEEDDDDILGLVTDGQDYSVYAGIPIFKRGHLAFTPRIGRRKRSISSQESGAEAEPPKGSETWNFSEAEDYDDIRSRDLIPVPRFGRRAFIPRIGKKSDSRLAYMEDLIGKRAAAFTPRIGRAPLVPRIGRSDPSVEIHPRAAFIPRIGRAALNPRIGRAAFVPRVGRSEAKNNLKENQKASS